MTKEKTKEEELVIKVRLQDEIIQDLSDDVVELSKPQPIPMFSKEEDRLYSSVRKLRRENVELKKLLKESFESFPTKRLADRIYSIDGIERPEPEPIPMKPGEETSF